MIAGHFGVGAAAKRWAPDLPLWALMLAPVWLDVIFVPLFAAGVETAEDAPGTDGGPYGESIIHADWTHSLVGALVITLVTAFLVQRWWGRRGAYVIGGLVFSHWILDFVVHRDDMPLLPGNAGDIRVGLGVWESAGASIALEAALVCIGAFLYWRATKRNDAAAPRNAGLIATLIAVFGAIVLITNVTVG